MHTVMTISLLLHCHVRGHRIDPFTYGRRYRVIVHEPWQAPYCPLW